MNVIDDLGILAISTRLQRLSEQFRKDGAALYKAYNIDFEPKWFPVIYTLSQKKMLSIIELADEIGYTHPSTINLLKELEKQKLIRSTKDRNDERKRLVQLTSKGAELIVKMKPVWELMTSALTEILETDHHLLKAITAVEENLRQHTFLQRSLKLANLNSK